MYIVIMVALGKANGIYQPTVIGWLTFAFGLLSLLLVFLYLIFSVKQVNAEENKYSEALWKLSFCVAKQESKTKEEKVLDSMKMCGKNVVCQEAVARISEQEPRRESSGTGERNSDTQSRPYSNACNLSNISSPAFQREVASLSPDCRQSLRSLMAGL